MILDLFIKSLISYLTSNLMYYISYISLTLGAAMAGLAVSAASAASSYVNSSSQPSRVAASNDVPPMHDAIFESPEVAIAHEQAAYASHGIAVSKEYATYLCSFGLSMPQGGAALGPEEWEAANSKKNVPAKVTTVDNNFLLNSLKSNLDNLITSPSSKITTASLNKSKLDTLYNQLYL